MSAATTRHKCPGSDVRVSTGVEWVQCDDCDGAGEWCGHCRETPDNCDCDPWDDRAAIECPSCGGSGEIEIEIDDEGDGG